MENKNEKQYEYASKVVMSNDKYKDVTMITYSKYTAFLQVVSVIFAVFYAYQLVVGKNYQLLCMNSGILLGIAVVIYLALKRNKIEDFEKSFRQKDGSFIEYETCFKEDKIEVRLSNGISGEYRYEDVKTLKESEKLFFVEMPKDFHIVVNKEMECNQEENDFAKFLFGKCGKMRERRIVNIAKEKKSFEEVMILLGAAFVVALVMYTQM